MGHFHQRSVKPRHAPAWPIALFALLLGGCYSPSYYTGHGAMTETYEYGHVYKISFGEVDLTREGRAEFSLSGHPGDEFAIGLNVLRQPGESAAVPEPYTLDADVRLRLLNDRDEVVIDETSDLRHWNWSRAFDGSDRYFVNRPGSFVEIPTASGGANLERTSLKPDGGWGSTFEPRHGRVYRLELTVLQADSDASDYRVELIAYGGWRFFI